MPSDAEKAAYYRSTGRTWFDIARILGLRDGEEARRLAESLNVGAHVEAER